MNSERNTAVEINKVQELQFDLMREASFNGFDGDTVVNSLVENRALWRGCIFDRPNLIKLRDIPDGHWNADTLWILPAAGCENALRHLADEWGADEVDWVGGEEACSALGSWTQAGRDNERAILCVWWD